MPQINHKFFSLHFGNAIVTNQLPQFFFLNSSPRFRQLGCHNSFFFFFPSHFRQLSCHNSYFLSPPFPPILATWLPQLVSLWALHIALTLRALHTHLGSKNFGNLITEIQFFLPPPSHHLSLLSLILFLAISATPLPKFTLFPHFSK